MNIEDDFRKNLKRLNIGRGSSCLVALSGGADSVALLDLCSRVASDIYAARVAHNIREEEQSENLFCTRICAEMKLPFEILNVEKGYIAERADALKCGIEAAARLIRYEHLEKQAQKLSVARILFAHTADDLLETILMRVLSGSGPEGLAGIPVERGIIARPLLNIAGEQLRRYLKERELSWMEDASNSLPLYRRNRIRHELIPLMTDIFPGWQASLFTLGERAGQSSESLRIMQNEKLPYICEKYQVKWNAPQWDKAPPYIQAMAVWSGFNYLSPSDHPEKRLPWSTLRAIRSVLQDKRVWRGYNIELSRSEDFIIMRRTSYNGMDEKQWRGRMVFDRSELIPGVEFCIGERTLYASLQKLDAAYYFTMFPDEWPLLIDFEVKGTVIEIKKNTKDTDSSSLLSHDSKDELVYIGITG